MCKRERNSPHNAVVWFVTPGLQDKPQINLLSLVMVNLNIS